MVDNDQLVDLLIVTFSIIALAEIGRATCFINIPFGVLLIGLVIPCGKINDSYGSWNRYIV